MQLILSLIIALYSISAYAVCTVVEQTCISGAETRLIEGHSIFKECWEYQVKYKCLAEDYINHCHAIESTPGCEVISTNCEDESCNKISNTFKCGNLLNHTENIIFLDSDYTITKDVLDDSDCKEHQDKNCVATGKICISGPQTRIINGKEVFKECWEYKSTSACYDGSLISDCQEYSQNCSLISEKCLSDTDGTCRHKEKKYSCNKIIGQTPTTMQCNGVSYCIGGECETQEIKPNQNMGKALSALSMLKGASIEQGDCLGGDASKCPVFKGQAKQCKFDPVHARNCCKESGWLKDMKLTECSEDERLLAYNKEGGLCHEIGSFCSQKLARFCLQKSKSYCCFGSKLSRIIHEEGRKQLNISWGTPQNPNCRALTVDELQSLNFDKMDLSEIYNELISKVNPQKLTDLSEQEQSIKRQIKEYYGN
jgi:conjugal transfer mating pair stabilization protein TraN